MTTRHASLLLVPTLFSLALAVSIAPAQTPSVNSAQASAGMAEVPVRGVVRPARQATLASTLRARILAIKVREGDRFAAGDVLVEFDCRSDQADLAAARALRKEREVSLSSVRYLHRMKAGSADELAIAEARLEQSDAEIRSINVRLDNCRITAPYAGLVRQVHARSDEFAVEGTPVISVLDPVSPEIELIASSSALDRFAPGRRFAFRTDETGETHQAVIRAVAPSVDAVSQTIKIYARFAESRVTVLPGMSGDAILQNPGPKQ